MNIGETLRITRVPDPRYSNGLDIQCGDMCEVIEYSEDGSLFGPSGPCGYHYKVKIKKNCIVTYMKLWDVEPLTGWEW